MIRIATRGSALALWQANHIRARLQAADPELAVELEVIRTRGDKILDRALSEVGGKGLFVTEIEEALLDGQAQIAVHSMKDLPATLAPGLFIAAIPERHDPRDALVVSARHAARELAALPKGARVGTSSLRRSCQLRALVPELEIVPLRGNVDTRLRRLDEVAGTGETARLDALVLASAGLERLGLGSRITARLDPRDCLPAVGQGALAVECRVDDLTTEARLRPLHHRPTAEAVACERGFLARLDGGCQTPLGALAVHVGPGRLRLTGFVGQPDGRVVLRAEKEGAAEAAVELGVALAEELLGRGADRILAACRTSGLVGGA